MKKILLSVLTYVVFALVVCLIVSAAQGNIPQVLEGQRGLYLFFRGLHYFLTLLPALFGSAYLVVLSIYFGQHPGNASERFSPAIFKHFKSVMISSLCMVFVLAMTAEVGLPAVNARQRLAEQAPRLLNEYLISGRYCLVIKNYYLAHAYGRQALRLSPGNKEAQELIDDSERNLHRMQARPQTEVASKPVDLEWRELQNETVTSLLEKARKAYTAEHWFDAHYYAQIALSSGDGKDINLQDARRLAADSWNKLNDSAPLTDFAAKKLFDQKKKAYSHLMSGDNLEAYYEFLELSQTQGAQTDPDVKNFFDIAKERLAREAFFIDETLHLQLFEAAQNVYFTVTHSDGAKDVVFIKGITTVSNSGRMIQYLREFTLYSYARDGHFQYAVATPYAKLVAEPVSVFDEQTALENDVQESFKTVPYIILRSVSRDLTRIRHDPAYTFAPDLSPEKRTERAAILLAMPFTDFNLACDTAAGAKDMNLLTLMKTERKARQFGRSEEVMSATVTYRLTYPLLLLILFLCCASFSWNYRMNKGQVFKFLWAFILPICTVVVYLLTEMLRYASEMFCYALVGFSGQYALFVAVGMYAVLFVSVSVLFLARNTQR